MGFADYLTSLNLDPGAAEKLTAQYGAPTPDEMAQYGASPAEAAAAQRVNSADVPQAATNPVAADPAWDPATEQKKTAEFAQQKQLDAATPQGPAGSDGFPTYRDLSAQGAPEPMAPGGVATPAHWQHSTSSEKRSGKQFDPNELQSVGYHNDAADGLGMMAADKHLEAAQVQAQADEAYAQERVKANQVAQAQAARVAQQKQAFIDAEHDKLNRLSVAAQQQVDPEAAKGPAGAQMLAAIAIGLGQFGASLTGGTNAALQIVQSNIDRRIAAQRDNIGNANKHYDREMGIYKDNLAEFGDRERAALATKAMLLDQADAMLKQQYAVSKKTANEGEYLKMQEGIQRMKAETVGKWAEKTALDVETKADEKFVPASTGAAPGGKDKEALYVPTLGGYARDPETARKLNAHATLRSQISEDLHGIHSLLEQSKPLNSVTDHDKMERIRTDIKRKTNSVLQKTTVLADQGAMSNGDKSVAEARSALENVDPRASTADQISRMQHGIRGVVIDHQRDARLEAEANGIQLGREGYKKDAKGNVVPVTQLAGRNKVVTKKAENADDLIEAPKGKSDRE